MKLEQELLERFLEEVVLDSPSPYDPVQVLYAPHPWEIVGTGNYAGVFCHPDYPDVVVKLYAPGKPGIEEESEVYRRLGESKYYPICYEKGENYLVIKRMRGISLFDCVRYGIPIPENVIKEVDEALDEARAKGLYPQDVHGKNVLMYQGHAYIIDVSDYIHPGEDRKWKDIRRAYYRIYYPYLKERRIKIPLWVLDLVRKGYRFYRKLKGLTSLKHKKQHKKRHKKSSI
ncbi:serine/threonine protein kinase [Brevibacillus halotolerans]|uniref:serine/threonine protein kinase n=1 Tax=Brevibacillus TaxID=55080 RepID=UPI00215C2EB1|nr:MULTISPECIES: serine/threonine protein kinase [Brevibacillus]MCR8962278.1 serine/threonine protein kinase [Brevibacillus laterosporus]MCZ0834433.1 serine/threonine protein kinase [Brevibacillus halotolerans]